MALQELIYSSEQLLQYCTYFQKTTAPVLDSRTTAILVNSSKKLGKSKKK